MDVTGHDGCGTHAGAACAGHASPCNAHAQACSGHAEACGAAADACCQSNAFMIPTTDEVVTISATDLAWLLDRIESSVESSSELEEESYVRSRNALHEQAPRLVALREDFLNQIKALMAES